jgi:tRNA A37 threonylcarbamoyladenosine synthetase subunit TsaC/SUA5/YrdC
MNEIERAAEGLRTGGVVVFSTGTVYGLGAD